ncbi:hypothetical protein N7470_000398 [Penicillium chermesinum]|nr:hypothetical protein N7470_000398 [Penicillium chermesinum]
MGSRLDSNSSAVRKRIENRELIEVDLDEFRDETGEEYEASAFGGFGDYMRRKKIKLQNLDAEIRASSRDCPPIFRGIVAHVNGYTQPSLQDLHRLIVSHGGGFLQYLDNKTSATHIIASSLTPKKRDEFRRYRIVKPAWVTESIKAGRLLPWNEFRAVDEGQSQKILKFGGGHMTSETNTLRSGYREQSNTSWYNSQLLAADSGRTSGPPQRSDSLARQNSPDSTPVQEQSAGTSTTLAGDQWLQANDQEQSTTTPSKQRTILDLEDPDELESPHKDASARIQVDPVLSNSAHKPLNLSGSQFIMPPRPEPKGTPAPVSDIRSKLAAQARPRKSPGSASPCPRPRQSQPSPTQSEKSCTAGHSSPSQLDPEALAALPEDIRNEVLGYYDQQYAAAPLSALSSPAAASPVAAPRPTEGKRNISPPKKEPTKSNRPNNSANKTLAKFGFISQAAAPTSSKGSPGPTPSPPPPAKQPQAQPQSSTPGATTSPGKRESSPSEVPVFTSQGLSNLEDLQNAISAWHSTFISDGPYSDDVEALCTYLRRVITEENDTEKAVSVVRWLMWLVGQHGQEEPQVSPDEDVVSWADAIETMQQSVRDTLRAKGQPAVDFA